MVCTNNAVELVTATKGLGVRTSMVSPLTYSNGHELITRLEFQLGYSEKLVVIKQGTANPSYYGILLSAMDRSPLRLP